MKVGIWGWFHTGNYGDELMALYVAKALRELGAEALVFGARPELAEQHGFARSDDVAEFFAQIAFCVFAEGGCLVDAGDSGNDKAERYEQMSEAALRENVVVYPFSIGGNGSGRDARPKGGLDRLWHRGVFGDTIVRLPGDLELVESFGATSAVCVPDMLWEAADYLLDAEEREHQAVGDSVHRIGLNFLRRQVPDGLDAWVAERVPEDIEIIWLAVHTERRVKGELRAGEESDRVKIFRHDDPLELLRFVGTLNVVVSSKLHVGLTALSQGTTFLSCGGRPKTHAQLREVEASLIREESAVELIGSLFEDGKSPVATQPSHERIGALKTASAENRTWLKRWVDRRR